jgi:uncharacterized membrane protein YphA (DoxX/SURF4 family)
MKNATLFSGAVRNTTLQLLVAGTVLMWSYAALSKLADPATTRRAMRNQVFGNQAADVLTWLVPGLELAAAAGLCFRRTRPAALMLSFILMFAFTAYVGMILWGSPARVPCSCGGILSSMSWEAHFLFNLAMLTGITAAGILDLNSLQHEFNNQEKGGTRQSIL